MHFECQELEAYLYDLYFHENYYRPYFSVSGVKVQMALSSSSLLAMSRNSATFPIKSTTPHSVLVIIVLKYQILRVAANQKKPFPSLDHL